ncbi:hypothetical protein M0813_20918 [Anaeramoeba flamelloides]|uniref:Uncharacterized protein n=1 Tax=Anaeramoeba flamelloides TaxID=1746091 RepID=A0ABQ8YJV0_9EUKA|nr:hypothetical protein M0813_20918 [Anaeramoeba flamelloides]
MSKKKNTISGYKKRKNDYKKSKYYTKQEKLFTKMIPDKETQTKCLKIGETSSYLGFLEKFSELFPKVILFKNKGKNRMLKFPTEWKYALSHCRCISSRNLIDGIRTPLKKIGLYPQKVTDCYCYLPLRDLRSSTSVERKRSMTDSNKYDSRENKYKKYTYDSEEMQYGPRFDSVELKEKYRSISGDSFNSNNYFMGNITNKMGKLSIPKIKNTKKNRKKKKKILVYKKNRKRATIEKKRIVKEETNTFTKKQIKGEDSTVNINMDLKPTIQMNGEKEIGNSNIIFDNFPLQKEKKESDGFFDLNNENDYEGLTDPYSTVFFENEVENQMDNFTNIYDDFYTNEKDTEKRKTEIRTSINPNVNVNLNVNVNVNINDNTQILYKNKKQNKNDNKGNGNGNISNNNNDNSNNNIIIINNNNKNDNNENDYQNIYNTEFSFTDPDILFGDNENNDLSMNNLNLDINNENIFKDIEFNFESDRDEELQF